MRIKTLFDNIDKRERERVNQFVNKELGGNRRENIEVSWAMVYR